MTSRSGSPLERYLEDQVRRRRRAVIGWRVVAWTWFLAWPLVTGVAFDVVGPATHVCPASDPDGGLLADAEPCRGDSFGFGFLLGTATLAWPLLLLVLAHRVALAKRERSPSAVT